MRAVETSADWYVLSRDSCRVLMTEEALAHDNSRPHVLLNAENTWAHVNVTLRILLTVTLYHVLLGLSCFSCPAYGYGRNGLSSCG